MLPDQDESNVVFHTEEETYDLTNENIPVSPELETIQNLRNDLVKIIEENKDKFRDKLKTFESIDAFNEYANCTNYLNWVTHFDNWFAKLVEELTNYNLSELATKLKEEVRKKKLVYKFYIQDSVVNVQAGNHNKIIKNNAKTVECQESCTEEEVTCTSAQEFVHCEFDDCDSDVEDSFFTPPSESNLVLKDEPDSSSSSQNDSGIVASDFGIGECDLAIDESDIGSWKTGNEISKTEIIKLRDYQEELAEKAMQAKNAIICAPTNSGKTIVAADIIIKHLMQSPETKVAFIVPKRILLNQQATIFTQYFGIWKVKKRAGSNPDSLTKRRPLDKLMKDADVLVMTADILKNGLMDDTIKFSDFTLIIFDECHHCMNEHSYNEIMYKYLLLKRSYPEAIRPQILGLTASPATNGKMKIKEIKSKIYQLCANMDSIDFVTVTDNEEGLKVATSNAKKIYKSKERRPDNPFKNLIKKMMDCLQKWIHFVPGVPPELPQYNSKLAREIEKATTEENMSRVQCLEMLMIYHEALRCFEILQMSNALEILKECHHNLEIKKVDEKINPMELNMLKLFQAQEATLELLSKKEENYPNPILDELKDNLKEAILENENHVRAIIFVRTQENARALQRIFDDDDDIKNLNPGIILGGNAASSGMSINKQTATLKKFNSGEIKVIISTSVSEEGLDIPSCNLVIKYNYMTNEVASYQMFGRARQADSKCISIGTEEYSNKELANFEIQERVPLAVRDMKQISRIEFLANIRAYQDMAISKKALKMEAQELRYSQNDASSVKFKCGNCLHLICLATDIYQIGNNYCTDFDVIKETTEISLSPSKKDLSSYALICKSCHHKHLGSKNNDLHCLSIKNFVVEVNGKSQKISQWKARTFPIARREL